MRYIWLLLVALAVVVHAMLPRYEVRMVGNAPITFDRWTGHSYFDFGLSPCEETARAPRFGLYQPPAPARARGTIEAQFDRWVAEAQAAGGH